MPSQEQVGTFNLISREDSDPGENWQAVAAKSSMTAITETMYIKRCIEILLIVVGLAYDKNHSYHVSLQRKHHKVNLLKAWVII